MTVSNQGNNTIIISSMHRSGSSLTASLLESAGLHIGRRLMGASSDNQKGHFENLDFYEFHKVALDSQGIHPNGWTLQKNIEIEDILIQQAKKIIAKNAVSDLWGWKEPRTTLFLNFWKELLPEAKFILIYRFPWEVVDSLYRRIKDIVFQKNPEFAVKVWSHYNNNILDFYNKYSNSCFLVDIHTLIANQNNCIQAIKEKWNINLNLPESSIYDPTLLQKQNSNGYRPSLIQATFPEAIDIYKELEARAWQPEEIPDFSWQRQIVESPYRIWAFQDWVNLRRLEKQNADQQEQQTQTLKEKDNQLEAIQKELQQSQQEKQQTQQQLEALQTEHQQTQQQLQESQQALQQSQQEKQQTQQQLESLQAEHQQTQQQLQQSQQEKQQTQQQLEALQTEHQQTQQQLQESQQALQQSQQEKQQTQQQLESLQAEHQQTQQQLQQSQQEKQQTQQQLEALQTEHQQTQQQLQESQQALQQSQQEKQQTQQQLESLQAEHQQTQQQLQQSQQENQETQQQLESTEQELTQTKNQLQETKNLLWQSQELLNETGNSLEKSQFELTEVKQQYQQTQQQLQQSQQEKQETQQQLEALQTEHQQTQQQLQQSQQEKQQTQQQLESLQAEHQQTQQQLQQSQQENQETQQQLESTEQELTQTKNQLQETKNLLWQSQELLNETGNSLEKSQFELTHIKVELQQTREELENFKFQQYLDTKNLNNHERNYQYLVWRAWRCYLNNDLETMVNYLQQSLQLTYLTHSETMMNWLLQFCEYSSQQGESLEIDQLINSNQWEHLTKRVISFKPLAFNNFVNYSMRIY